MATTANQRQAQGPQIDAAPGDGPQQPAMAEAEVEGQGVEARHGRGRGQHVDEQPVAHAEVVQAQRSQLHTRNHSGFTDGAVAV